MPCRLIVRIPIVWRGRCRRPGPTRQPTPAATPRPPRSRCRPLECADQVAHLRVVADPRGLFAAADSLGRADRRVQGGTPCLLRDRRTLAGSYPASAAPSRRSWPPSAARCSRRTPAALGGRALLAERQDLVGAGRRGLGGYAVSGLGERAAHGVEGRRTLVGHPAAGGAPVRFRAGAAGCAASIQNSVWSAMSFLITVLSQSNTAYGCRLGWAVAGAPASMTRRIARRCRRTRWGRVGASDTALPAAPGQPVHRLRPRSPPRAPPE